MKTYKYEELSERAKGKVRSHFYDDDWWYHSTKEQVDEFLYDICSAAKIDGVDIDRGQRVEWSGNIVLNHEYIEKMAENYGGDAVVDIINQMKTLTALYKIIPKDDMFEETLSIEVADGKYNNDSCSDDSWYVYGEGRYESISQACKQLVDDMSSLFLKWFRDEYDYMTSEECIVETIEANDYHFEEDGSFA